MIHIKNAFSFKWMAAIILTACVTVLFTPVSGRAQIFSFTREELIEYTDQNPFDRFPDGRPKIPDVLLERARGLSSEEIRIGSGYGDLRTQFVDGFHILHPGKKMVGRAVTVQFMPARADLTDIAREKAKARGLVRRGIDKLQPGDIIVVDLFGKKEQGTFVGDNLFYYIMKATDSAGMVLDGSMRDLEGVSMLDMQAYFRHADPSAIGNVMLTGYNVPIRIGNATVMPGDLVMGDREGVNFIAPALVEHILDKADSTHIHDEWTRMKFDEGIYKSIEIYGSPRDPELKKEYEEFLTKRLEEIKRNR
ncbi:RraA family protein [Candidatus Latescibacterota bacterium]